MKTFIWLDSTKHLWFTKCREGYLEIKFYFRKKLKSESLCLNKVFALNFPNISYLKLKWIPTSRNPSNPLQTFFFLFRRKLPFRSSSDIKILKEFSWHYFALIVPHGVLSPNPSSVKFHINPSRPDSFWTKRKN